MRKRRSKDGVTVNAVAGTHVVTLGFDLDEKRRKGCLGFAIQREDHTEDERYWMTGMKTFVETDPGLGPGGQVSSREHPFQGFQWADYSAKPDHEYTYRVIPLYGTPEKLKEGAVAAVKVATEPELGKPHSVFFNRGSVASQEYARRFQNVKPNKLTGESQLAAQRWLSRGLLEALLAFIDRAKDKDFGLYGAIYEFEWHAVLDALREADKRGAEVKIAYDRIGSENPGKKNKAAIALAGIEKLTTPRTTGTIMHNKFLVLTRKGTPVAVWTGSTNLSLNGIFGHLNCGHIVEGTPVARKYLKYWEELSAVPSPKADAEQAWVDANNPNPPNPWKDPLTTVFSPHSSFAVLDWYASIAGSAHEALFMTFAFGMDDRFQKVYKTKDEVLRVALMDKEGSASNLAQGKKDVAKIRARPNVLIAVGNKITTNSFDRWLAESGGLTQGVQWVHTKFMLVDPLSDAPVVVTGSANFSENSTDLNNENMLVIRGDTRVADIYLGEYMRLYAHYAFRESVKRSQEKGETEWRPSRLVSGPEWQDDYFKPGHDRSLRRVYFARSG